MCGEASHKKKPCAFLHCAECASPAQPIVHPLCVERNNERSRGWALPAHAARILEIGGFGKLFEEGLTFDWPLGKEIYQNLGYKFSYQASFEEAIECFGKAHSFLKVENKYHLIFDNIASFDSTKILAEKLQKQKKVDIKFKAIKGADHFYENYSEDFTSIVDNYIKDNLQSNW